MAAYLDHTALGLPMREVARRRGVQASTVLRQVRRVEDARDCRLFDAQLDLLQKRWGEGGTLTPNMLEEPKVVSWSDPEVRMGVLRPPRPSAEEVMRLVTLSEA